MAKHVFYASKDITDEKAKVLAKGGEVAVTIETDLPLDRALNGLQTGRLTKDKPKPAAEKSAAAPSNEPKKPDAK